MIDVNSLKRLFSCLLVLVFGIAVAFGVTPCTATDRGPLVPQDLSSLKTSDGKIVDQRKVDLPLAFSDKVDCYKIKYLSDGLRVVGFMLTPKIQDKRFPILVYNRGGNRDFGAISQKTLPYLSYLSSKGYLVVASQYRGNDGGEGRESFGGADVNDVMNLIPLARSLEFSDPNRIVMLGYSRGGMMTYLAIKNGVQVRAAAVVGGITDIEQTYRERESGMKHVIEELVGRNERDWKERSAYYFPEKINVPVLILHGEDDARVRVSQAKKLADKLQALGKEYELVIFPNGDHGLNTHKSQRDSKILDFYAKYLH